MRLSIGARLLAAFLTITALGALTAVVATTRLSQVSSTTGELARREIPEVHQLWRIRTLISEMGMGLEHLLDSVSDKEATRLRAKHEAIERSLAAYRKLHPHLQREEERLFEELRARYEAFRKTTSRALELIRSGSKEKAGALLRGRWYELNRALAESSRALLLYEDREMLAAAARAQAKSTSGRNAVITLTLVGLVLSVALTFLITRSITSPLKKLVFATERAMQGDLASQSEVARDDEIGVLAQRFDAMLGNLRRSFEDQRRFFADASHELRNPVTVIRGEAEVALRAPEKPAGEYREALQTIATLAGEMGRLVDDLLFLARAEAGQIRYEMTTTHLVPLIEEVYEQSRSLALLKSVHLKLDLMSSVTVRGDPWRLKHLFLILVDNAIKYSEPSGTVRIALATSSEGAMVSVSDTGTGIRENDLPHIFERFYRADSARAGSETGTGLGLSIAKSIVEAHKGQISVQSTIGQGTTFLVVLPFAEV